MGHIHSPKGQGRGILAHVMRCDVLLQSHALVDGLAEPEPRSLRLPESLFGNSFVAHPAQVGIEQRGRSLEHSIADEFDDVRRQEPAQNPNYGDQSVAERNAHHVGASPQQQVLRPEDGEEEGQQHGSPHWEHEDERGGRRAPPPLPCDEEEAPAPSREDVQLDGPRKAEVHDRNHLALFQTPQSERVPPVPLVCQRKVEQDEVLQHADEADEEGDGRDFRHVPPQGLGGSPHAVLAGGHRGEIIHKRQDDEHPGWEVEAQNDDSQEEEPQDEHGGGHAVHDVAVEPGENFPGALNRCDDGREPRRSENNVGGCLGGIRGARHGNAHIGPLQSWCVVHAVAGHSHEVVPLLQRLHNAVLVLREN
mmetsp:Transcript_30963/g.86751  ORF Transcript_30963/g.86751 Transcript_30963/m.86751 type:complete len:364 (-) Transcript_30963:1713-2804(-)